MKQSTTTQTLYAMKHLRKTVGQLLALSHAYDVGEVTPRSAEEATGIAHTTLSLTFKTLAAPDDIDNTYLVETRTEPPISGGGHTRFYKLTPHGRAVITGIRGGKQ